MGVSITLPMNAKTCKLIRRYSALTRRSYKELKRVWNAMPASTQVPAPSRAGCRIAMKMQLALAAQEAAPCS